MAESIALTAIFSFFIGAVTIGALCWSVLGTVKAHLIHCAKCRDGLSESLQWHAAKHPNQIADCKGHFHPKRVGLE
jgi:hypothetical protein